MKNFFFSFIFLMFCHTCFSQYQDYNTSWNFNSFTLNPYVGGGGSVQFKILNNVLTVNFSGGFSNTPLKTGQVVQIQSPNVLPNLYLGTLNTNDCYEVRIVNNYLNITCAEQPSINGFNKLFTINLVNPSSWPTDPNIDQLDENLIYPVPTDNQNYIYTITPQIPVTELDNVPAIKADHSIVYFDELGRAKQNIFVGQSPNLKDQVSHIEYDDFGRQTKEYLTYPSQNQNNGSHINTQQAIAENILYHSTNYNDNNIYSEVLQEKSPIGKILKQGFPGADWQINPNSDDDNTVKYVYGLNLVSESIKKFSVNHTNNNIEKTELVFDGYYLPNKLSKRIIKDENWKPSQVDPKSHTVEEFLDGFGRVILKRTYDSSVSGSLDTYYVYDDFGYLTYVLPPKASDEIIEFGNQGFRMASNRNFPWTQLVNVDSKFADEYEKKLSEYENENILNVDLENEYDGQGGFSVVTLEESEILTLSISYSANIPFELKKGELVSLKEVGIFKDTELGRIKGADYEYVFIIQNNSIYIEGNGKLSVINQSFTSNTKLDYYNDYLWTNFIEVDPEFAISHEKDVLELAKKNNQSIYDVYIENDFGGEGGLSISIDENDIVTLSINTSFDTPVSLKKGLVIPLDTQRRIERRYLGSISGNGYFYDFAILENSLHIYGNGTLTDINIVFTTPPDPNSPMTTPAAVEGLCYIYHYDKKGRIIEKKIPGKDWEYIIYDKQNRIVMSQDANMRSNDKWVFTKYDIFGRVVYTGIIKETMSRWQIQNSLNTATNPILNEVRSNNSFNNGGRNIWYTNAAYPFDTGSNEFTVLSINYYDDYNFDSVNQGSLMPPSVFDVPLTTETKSLATGSYTRVLDTNNWIQKLIGYDTKGRDIYGYVSDGYLDYNQTVKKQVDFMGYTVQSETAHNKKVVISSGGHSSTFWISTIIEDFFTYDHVHRLLAHTQKEKNKSHEELIAFNKYNEEGVLVQKKVGNIIGSNYNSTKGLQTVDYSYNIRGWLKGINDINDNLSAGKDLFSFSINYNTTGLFGSVPLYNGNIAETHWKTKTDNKIRSYAYRYDELNRLRKADYKTPYPLYNNPNAEEKYAEKIIYDKNGNILHLDRYGLKGTNTIDKIDDLVYDYEPYSNKLINVTDNGFAEGFKDDPDENEDDYSYDANGNMTRDLNKGIIAIEYNYLNLPEKVTFNNGNFIEYIYDAQGNKLKKVVNDNLNITTTEYNSGFVYQKQGTGENKLQFFPSEEGYVTRKEGDLAYIYQYKDHLGNTRLSYTDAVQENVDITFHTNTEGFNESGNATTDMQNGALVVNVTGPYDGVIKGISTSTSAGEHYEFNLTLDRGTTNAVSVVIRESDPSEGVWEEFPVAYLSPGQQMLHFEHTASADNLGLSLFIRKTENTNVTTTFKVLYLGYKKKEMEVVEENNYYAFGMKHYGYNSLYNLESGNAIAEKYKYNGKELQDELNLNMYDYGARNYDPAIGRWFNVDPLAEQMRRFSPYVYVFNNPLRFTDPDGMEGDDIIFRNKNKEELGRIKLDGEDVYIDIDTERTVARPIEVNPLKIMDKLGVDKLDAAGIGIEYSGTVGGGMNFGFEAVYFFSGEDKGKAYLYDKKGGNVGLEGSISVYGFGAVKADENVTAESWLGKFSFYSGGYGRGGAQYFWSNSSGRAELWPGHRGDKDWEGAAVSGGYAPGLKLGGKWGVSDYSFAEWAGDNGKIYDKDDK